VRPDLQEVVAHRAQDLDLPPAQPGVEHEPAERIVGGAVLVERAQRLHEPVLPLHQGRDTGRGPLHLEAVHHGRTAVGQADGDPHLLGGHEPEVLQRAQGVGERERAHGVELDGQRRGRARHDPHLEPRLQLVEPPDVLGHLLGRRHLAVEAAAALLRDVAAEERPPFALAVGLLQRGRGAVFPGRDQVLGEGADDGGLERVFEPRGVEIVEEQAHRAEVLGGAEGDGAELVRERLGQVLLDPVGVTQPREGDGEGLVPRPLARVHGDLVVAGHVDDAVDDLLQRLDVRVEQLARGEAVEDGADLAVRERIGLRVAVLEQPVELFLQERDLAALLGEGALGQAAHEQRGLHEIAVRSPLPDGDVVDGLEVIDRGRGVAVVDVDDPKVVGRGQEVGLHLLDQPREDDGQQRRIGEDPARALRHAVGLAVGTHPVADGALEDVVVVEQPFQERARRVDVSRTAAPALEPRQDLARGGEHLLEVLDRGEDRLEHRVDLVLDVPQALLRLDPLDLEVTVDLARALVVRSAQPDDALPLAAHGEDGMHGREDAQARLAEVVLEALEDERRVGRVRLDDRDLLRQAVGGAPGHPARFARVARDDVQAGQSLVELRRGGHLADDEPELVREPGGEGLGGQAERHPVGHLREHDRGERKQQLAVLARGLPHEDLAHLREFGGPLRWIGGDHRARHDNPRPLDKSRRRALRTGVGTAARRRSRARRPGAWRRAALPGAAGGCRRASVPRAGSRRCSGSPRSRP
jgi:hypothetical protein